METNPHWKSCTSFCLEDAWKRQRKVSSSARWPLSSLTLRALAASIPAAFPSSAITCLLSEDFRRMQRASPLHIALILSVPFLERHTYPTSPKAESQVASMDVSDYSPDYCPADRCLCVTAWGPRTNAAACQGTPLSWHPPCGPRGQPARCKSPADPWFLRLNSLAQARPGPLGRSG